MNMNVTYLISENQKRQIIVESIGDELKNATRNNQRLVERIKKDVSKILKFDLSIMVSFSASIGGFIRPLESFLKGEFPQLTTMEISLILSGVIFQYVQDNQDALKKILSKIKDLGLTKEYKKVLSKSEQLKDSFLNFLGSLGLQIQKTTNIMGFTYIIPLIPMLYNSIMEGVLTQDTIFEITKRLGLFVGLNYGGVTLNEVLKSLINKLKK